MLTGLWSQFGNGESDWVWMLVFGRTRVVFRKFFERLIDRVRWEVLDIKLQTRLKVLIEKNHVFLN